MGNLTLYSSQTQVRALLRKKKVYVTIGKKEELTNNVLVGFKDDLVVGGLRRTLNVLLEKCIETLPTVTAAPNLHRMMMSFDMNAGSLGGPSPIEVEDFRIA